MVVELFPEEQIRSHYFFLPHLLDIDYEHLICDNTQVDLVVDSDELSTRLERALN